MKLLFDFSRVLLFPKDPRYMGSLNELYKKYKDEPDFNFFDHFRVNEELVTYLDSIKNNIEIYMFTSESIQDAPELKPIISPLFKKIYSALEIGFKKKELNAYLFIAADTKTPVDQILFIDDSLENLEAANNAGIKTLQYIDNKSLLLGLNQLN
jgi:HAD superfamily hydrolase (TIGR01509 family)